MFPSVNAAIKRRDQALQVHILITLSPLGVNHLASDIVKSFNVTLGKKK